MRHLSNLFIATIRMLLRDKTAFLMAVVMPAMFVVTFALFDVNFTGEGTIPGVDYFDFVLPGLLAIGLMNFGMIGAAASVARYRELQILKRILATPLEPSKFIAAQVAARLVLAAVQTAIIMVLGVLLGASLGDGWPWLFVIATLGNLIFLSLGMAIAGRVGSVDAANNTAGVATTPLMFLGGSFFPVDTLPGWLQPVADALPLTPLVDSMRDIALLDASITDVGPELAIIGAWVVASLALARLTFRFGER